ncbi:MAG: hypothetical protein KGH57_02320 [Candidatus Micrarchaeota archaeon]|nr:hypothetical protein [Candidatus Micrarchaeota archaeon]
MQREIVEFKVKPVLYLCSSKKEIAALVEASKRISKGSSIVLLLDNSERAAARVLPAYANAAIRLSEGIARSNSMQTEMLLLTCGTMNIGKALRECGAKRSSGFFVFASSQKLFEKFSKANKIADAKGVDLKMDLKIAGDVTLTELSNG